jgi:hypothetical protein
MHGKGTWRMLHQGMNVPLKVDTIVEHVGGQVANNKESDAEELDSNDSDSESLADLEEEEKEDNGKTADVKKVRQNKEQKMKSKFVICIAAQLTILFSISKGIGTSVNQRELRQRGQKKRKRQVDMWLEKTMGDAISCSSDGCV